MATSDLSAPAVAAAPAPPAGSGGGKAFAPFGEDGFTFADLLDVVNPLQHIPIIGTFYRQLTGDTLSPAARLAGGTLFGGPIGAALAGANIVLEDATGKDMGEQVVALFSGGDAAEAPAVAVAAAETAAGPAAPPVPDLALLGPLPSLPAPAPPVVAAASPDEAAPPVADLAALAPLAPARSTPVRTAGRRPIDPVPPGAADGGGGWFTQVMLSALEKYQTAARLAEKNAETAALTISN